MPLALDMAVVRGSDALLVAARAAFERDREELRTEAADLRAALLSSREIGAAIGILMERNSMSYDSAFSLLRSASQDLNRKLRDVAAHVLIAQPVAAALRANRTGGQGRVPDQRHGG